MSVLWEQRELIRTFEECALAQCRKQAAQTNSEYHLIPFMSEGNLNIAENVLVEAMLTKKNKAIKDVEYVMHIKRLISACVSDGFLVSEKNPDLGKASETNFTFRSSPRLLSINPVKGAELLDPWYFWFKHFLDVFPQPVQLCFQILIAIITALLTVQFVSPTAEKPYGSVEQAPIVTQLQNYEPKTYVPTVIEQNDTATTTASSTATST